MITWQEVCRRAAALPELEDGTSHGTPALKVRGKLIARLREDGETMAVRVDYEERLALVHSNPEAYLVTPHYENYPWVLVRLATVDAEELHELVVEAWLLSAPRRLAKEYEARHA